MSAVQLINCAAWGVCLLFAGYMAHDFIKTETQRRNGARNHGKDE